MLLYTEQVHNQQVIHIKNRTHCYIFRVFPVAIVGSINACRIFFLLLIFPICWFMILIYVYKLRGRLRYKNIGASLQCTFLPLN
jgi:hypothetical protein